MAIRNIQIVESDLSGEPAAVTQMFAVDDSWFEIDLTPEEQQEFKEALKPYLQGGRKARKPTLVKKRVVHKTTQEERNRIREWATENGYEPPARGQIPQEIQKAYDEAHDIDRMQLDREAEQSASVRRRVVHKTTQEERNRIREWATENGYEPPARGQIPQEI
ncbi:Lsr2 family protein, partial [Streptomyces sp. NPDC057654]|uniref:histone-like nucleoid-structuring protein Lsr2 n=1 Tax=Streptomyces sp. NPDC057654 TaxID=3346196 RepID=UPI003689ACB9